MKIKETPTNTARLLAALTAITQAVETAGLFKNEMCLHDAKSALLNAHTRQPAVCEHAECIDNDGGYCMVQSHADSWVEMSKELDHEWKDTVYVAMPTVLQFSGIALHLDPDGTYSLEDTTGG